MSSSDTIAAVASGSGPAAVGIVRLSGPEAFGMGRRICVRWPEPLQPRLAFATGFRQGDAIFDEGLVIAFPGPRSYTGEDVLELQGHGGHALRTLLATAISEGARLAQPGEFTQRAFLAGKIDLVQAESVARLIEAQTDRALHAARASLGGALSERIRGLEAELLALRGRVEGLLDFSAESEGAESGLPSAVDALASQVRAIAGSFAVSRRLFGRSEVVLVGPVNAGKSSLLNALVGEERALVDAAPGTTRDLVTVDAEVAGFPIRLVDTAGWREAEGVEVRGIKLGRAAAERAALVLWVTSVDRLEPAPDPRWLCVAAQRDRAPAMPLPNGFLAVSAQTGEGIEDLWAAIGSRLEVGGEGEALAVSERQATGLTASAEALSRAAGQPALELVADELQQAQDALASVRGEAVSSDVLDEVFRQFCVGK